MAQGIPVQIAANGRGIPVTVAANGKGTLATKVTNGRGIPVVHVAKGGMPIVYGGPVNLLAGLSWQADANTSLSVSGGQARATATNSAVGNPRIWKIVPVINGASYRATGQVSARTAGTNVRFRVSTNTAIPDGNIYEQIVSANAITIDQTFVATASTIYIGIVPVVTADGQYSEIDDAFSLVKL